LFWGYMGKEAGEFVQIVYHPRSKDRVVLTIAKITQKCPCPLTDEVTVADAIEDGSPAKLI
jgi:hypothetical protein